MFDKDLNFQKRIKLRTTQVGSFTYTSSIKLYEDKMYVMFRGVYSSPPFHLQIFDLEGELVKCLIEENEIGSSQFFSIDRLGNFIVADWGGDQIKIFSKEGTVLHTRSRLLCYQDQKTCPFGVAIEQNSNV